MGLGLPLCPCPCPAPPIVNRTAKMVLGGASGRVQALGSGRPGEEASPLTRGPLRWLREGWKRTKGRG